MKILRPSLFPILLLICSTVAVPAETLTLTPAADTGFFQAFPNNNLGKMESAPSGTTLQNSKTRMVLRFNLAAQLPTNAVITAVRLQCSVVKRPATGPVPSTFAIHRILKNWGEGTNGTGLLGTGALATSGGATWNARFHPSTNWTAAGGQAGSDYLATPSASVAVDNLGEYSFLSTSNLVQDIKTWLNVPGTNFGWILISQSEAVLGTGRRFATREHVAANNRPRLIIDYTVPPRIDTILLTNDTIQLTFQGRQGKSYRVEARASLLTGDWALYSNVATRAANGPVTVFDSPTTAPRLYRVGEF